MDKAESRKREAKDRAQKIESEARKEVEEERWDRSPSKHYVRRFGWLDIIRDYIAQREEAEVTSPIKYLTLPGLKAIDIGLLLHAGILQRNEAGKLNVAICDRLHAEKVAIKIERYGGVLAYSSKDLHVELSNGNNPIPKQFPFDVINLDFTDTLIKSAQPNLNAIQMIFEYQLGQGFLLLLTSRQNPNIQPRDREILEENLENQERFREAFVERFGHADVSRFEENYKTFYQIVNSKVMCRFGREYGYKTHERFASSYNRTGYRMGCHSFEFEPLGRRDPRNRYLPRFKRLARNRIEELFFDRLSEAVRSQSWNAYYDYLAALPFGTQIDVDIELDGSGALMAELDGEATSLSAWLDAE